MKVRNKSQSNGYVGGTIRKPDDVFEIRPEEFSERWMEDVDGVLQEKPGKLKNAEGNEIVDVRGNPVIFKWTPKVEKKPKEKEPILDEEI